MNRIRLLLFVLLLTAADVVWAFSPTVTTSLGTLEGTFDREDTVVWRGIPYAQPPVGELRWRAPRPVEPWEGVRRARRFGNAPLQYSPVFGNLIVGSEDCLYLNIWRPDTDEQDLPVYVWIHGGGNSIGSANQVSDYYGHALAARSNVVVVSINYRLGPFGWFRHPSFREESDPLDSSGNYGTLDIIEALRWVNAHIADFGGDPDRVLIAGESAGALNVLSLIASPLAQGLFSHAMVQSGYTATASVEQAETIGLRVQAELLEGVDVELDDPQALRAAADELSGKRIMRLFESGGLGMLGLPNVVRDGHVLPEIGLDAVFAAGDHASWVPLIIGSNLEESKLFMSGNRELRRSPELYQAATRYMSDSWKVDGVDNVARALTALDDHPPVYAYQFAWGAPDEEGMSVLPGRKGLWYGAFHTLEIPFFMGTDTIHGPLSFRFFRPSNRDGRHSLSAAMMSYVQRFIRSSPLTPPDLPAWQPWSTTDGAPKSMVFDYRDDALQLGMMDEAYTQQSIVDRLRAEYDLQTVNAVLALPPWPGD